MKTYLDSSVLISLLCAQSKFKAAADAALRDAAGKAFTSAHALAETYRTLTTLQHPVPPTAAFELVEGLGSNLRVVVPSLSAYRAALAFAFDKPGRSKEARIDTKEITTSNSINVKAAAGGSRSC